MFTRKFIYYWFSSVIAMFVLSYVWHGFILNDFERLSYSKSLFLLLFGIVYLGIGFVITLLNQLPYYEKHPIRRGLIFGCITGILVYLISFVIGISFIATPALKYVLFDAGWQMIEQSAGGLTIGLVHIYICDYERRMV